MKARNNSGGQHRTRETAREHETRNGGRIKVRAREANKTLLFFKYYLLVGVEKGDGQMPDESHQYNRPWCGSRIHTPLCTTILEYSLLRAWLVEQALHKDNVS